MNLTSPPQRNTLLRANTTTQNLQNESTPEPSLSSNFHSLHNLCETMNIPLQEQVTRVQDEKSHQVKKIMSDQWREQLRRSLNAEIDEEVRAVLGTPPETKVRNNPHNAVLRLTAQPRHEETDWKRIAFKNIKTIQESTLRELSFWDERYHLNDHLFVDGHPRCAVTRLPGFSMKSKSETSSVKSANNNYISLSSKLSKFMSLSSTSEDSTSDEKGDTAVPDPEINKRDQHHNEPSVHFRLGMEAMDNFDTLTSHEKDILFLNFTQQGYKDILRSGHLPDGTKVKEIRPGVYCDIYGLERDRNGPFWPRDKGPLHPRQKHVHLQCPSVEPLLLTNSEHQTVKENAIQRWKWGPQIVYDCDKSGRIQKTISSPSSEQHVSPSLIFESRFESGNLQQARRVNEYEYELILSTDLYTPRHTQWYYFRVEGMKARVTYKFTIINLSKKKSLYCDGMQPLFYSVELSTRRQVGWHRKGHKISYCPNTQRVDSHILYPDQSYYQLQWEMEFPFDEDTCYLAHCYPYTYSDLKEDLIFFTSDANRKQYIRKEILCETKAGNSCFLLTITQPNGDPEEEARKQGVVLTARVHPGETNASWMMRGLLDFLTSDDPQAVRARKTFIFKIIPMLNPDGVIVGNYRCSLAGRDLNRNYRKPRLDLFPTIWHTKRIINTLRNERQIALYCDFHGHSRKPNVFMYGCDQQYRHVEDVNSFRLTMPTRGVKEYLLGRLVPWIMAKQSPEKFCFSGCKFNIHKSKESTGRVVVWNEFKVDNSFTMESTFCGTTLEKKPARHFNVNDLECMGCSVIRTLHELHEVDKDERRRNALIKEMCSHIFKKMFMSTNVSQRLMEILKNQINPPNAMNFNDISEEKNQIYSSNMSQNFLDIIFSSLSIDALDDVVAKLLQAKISLPEESDSEQSDSNSEPEPEAPSLIPENDKNKRKRNLKQIRSKTLRSSGRRSSTAILSDAENERQMKASDKKISVPPERTGNSDIKVLQFNTKGSVHRQSLSSYPGYVNRYVGRTNNGIPCFTEERQMERAQKKMLKKMKQDALIIGQTLQQYLEHRTPSLKVYLPRMQDDEKNESTTEIQEGYLARPNSSVRPFLSNISHDNEHRELSSVLPLPDIGVSHSLQSSLQILPEDGQQLSNFRLLKKANLVSVAPQDSFVPITGSLLARRKTQVFGQQKVNFN